MGGTWTFRDGLELHGSEGTILQWALVAATVGVILRTLEERMGLIGRISMRIIESMTSYRAKPPSKARRF